MRLGLCKTGCVDPFRNLALERYLLENVGQDEVILYLWQNQSTVVIGRNQSALAECRIQKLKEDGGRLARRLSGGGAVFHDLGNLNFTFLAPSHLFSEEKQTEVILKAVRSLGIEAQRTGRNDLLAGGCKFSGHAYYHSKGRSYHHGTLLVRTDAEKMAAYLNPSPLKLAAKGVSSVKSRVCNLCDFVPELSIEVMQDALEQSFSEVYGETVSPVSLSVDDQAAIERIGEEFASEDWILKGERPLRNSREGRFDWGCVRLDWDELQGSFDSVALFSDGLDAGFLEAVPNALVGCCVERNAIERALSALVGPTPGFTAKEKRQWAADIASLVCSGRF